MIKIKTRVKLLLASCTLACSLPAMAQNSLDRCIELAYDNYPQIQEYGLIEASRGYDLANAAKAWTPQLSLSGKASWQSDVIEMPFGIEGFTFDIPHDQYGITAELNQQLIDGGATSMKKKLIEAGAEVKKKQLDVNLYAIRSRVQNIYLGINLIDRQIELNSLLQESLKRTLEEIDALVENGVAFSSDRDQIKVSILSCEQQRLGLETDRKTYVKMLSLLTGTDMQGELFAEPKIAVQHKAELSINRPEQELYSAQSAQIELQKNQLKTNLYPRLNLNLQAGYGRPGLNMLSGKFDPYFVAALRLQWNFGSFYTLKNDRRKLEAESNRVELAQKSFLLNTSIEALQKESEMYKAADVLDRDDEIIALRQNILDTAQQQYKEGVIKMNDYLSILDEAFKARLNLNIHTIQYIMAYYNLKNTTGNNK